MGLPNLTLRGGSYHWRRKITVSGAALPLCLSLGTGNLKRARGIADRLSVTVEGLRVAYGQSTGMRPDQLKRVFGDALRWQLQRIEEDQVGSAAPSGDHATINSLYAEAWSFLGRNGVEARWTLDEHERLIEAGWGEERAKAVAGLVFDFQNAEVVSKAQIDSYTKAFGIDVTRDNVARMARTICSARAAACHEATKRLPTGDSNLAQWIDDALADDAPFAFEEIVRPSAAQAVADAEPPEPVASRHAEAEPPTSSPLPQRSKKSLLEAGEDCIVARLGKEAWNSVSVNQVRTALRLFDHAAGGNVFIEDLKQCHVREFTQLCGKLPNRWGRTRDERTGGIAASLARAANTRAR